MGRHTPHLLVYVAVRQRLEISNRLSLGFQRNKNSVHGWGLISAQSNHTLDIGGQGASTLTASTSPWAAVIETLRSARQGFWSIQLLEKPSLVSIK